MEEHNYKGFFYPPGGILIWIIIFVELVTYALAMVGLIYYGSQERALYHAHSLLLSKEIATVNTILLITGGFYAALAVLQFKKENFEKTTKYLLWAMLLGVGFLLLKGWEYYQKIEAGYTMEYSSFFMNYWLLTGFHWLHVLVGVILLFFLRRRIMKQQKESSLLDLEAGIAFWHMCDIIWILLFPSLYLIL